MESEAFISSENSCISTSRRTLRGVGAYAPEGERDLPGRDYCRWNISAAKSVEFVLSKSGLGQGGMEYGSNECEGINPTSADVISISQQNFRHIKLPRAMNPGQSMLSGDAVT